MADTPIPAATLVLFRERAEAPPEVLMTERARAMAFAGGAMVFPGGLIDPGDHALATLIGGGADAAARIAAIRETIEEAGVAVGVTPAPSAERLAAMRAGLHAGEAFADILHAAGLTLDLEALVPFARWLPDHPGIRIFDTLFFLARAPDAAAPTVDATETVRLLWTTAADMLAAADRGEAAIIFPTRRNLERLAQFDSFDAAVANARAYPVRTITPHMEVRDGVPHLCLPEDSGYPVTAEPIQAVRRG